MAGVTTSASINGKKKTLADIQREEEVRKQKAKDLANQTGITSGSGIGKRYADLAGKGSMPPGMPAPSTVTPAAISQVAGGNGWATVGAGGKVKIPTGPAAQTRSVSTGNVKSAAPTVIKATTAKPVNSAGKDVGSAAMEEFNKWLHRELARGLSGPIDGKLNATLD
jgi:PERQ amino acid-rich with GYF domain-containing protein